MIPTSMRIPSLPISEGTPVPRKAQNVHSRRSHLDLLTRTSWTDARTALSQIHKGKATGNKAALWLRTKIQDQLFHLGCFIQRNAGKVLFVGLLVFSTFCVGLKSATMETNVEKLWVEEGGRLEKELRYIHNVLGEGSGNTNQILIQTPKEQGANVLHPSALLIHLQAVQTATQVTVEMFDVTWRLKDICYSPSMPSFDVHLIDSILENLFPCAIITPLDCFWEGAKLLGPEFPVTIPGLGLNVQWTNLNPQSLVESMKSFGNYVSSFPFATLEDFMKRAGITTAYQEKPCLDPSDQHCPETAPNKHTSQLLDVGAELTGGCYGFATRYMHWPEDLIVGGISKNRTSHIIKAEALQSVVQLMAEKEMFEYWQDTYKVHNLDWNVNKAKMVLEAWQRKFTEEVMKQSHDSNLTRHHSISTFSTTSLTDIIKDFSEMSITRVVLGYVLMLVYACISLLRWTDAVRSQSGIGIAGVLLVALSVIAGLGFCAIIGISFNAATTQIVPFLALGLGVDDMFLIAHGYSENESSDIPLQEQTGECMKRMGVGILLTSLSNVCAFFAAAIIPIPALRVFTLQAAILVIFKATAMLVVFPAIVSLDLRRRDARRVDVFCCFSGESQVAVPRIRPLSRKSMADHQNSPGRGLAGSDQQKRQAVTHALPPDRSHVVTVLAPPPPSRVPECWVDIAPCAPSLENLSTANSASTRELIKTKKKTLKEHCLQTFLQTQQECRSWSLKWLATNRYAPWLQKTSVKVLTIVAFMVFLAICIWGILHVEDGLDLTDLVPRSTNEYKFLSVQSKYFGFFNMFAITQGNLEYPINQNLLYEYHDAFMRIDKIIKNDDGGLPDFWLSLFRDWLLGLQKAFDRDWKNGFISQERWFPNASDEGILAYKLLVQTGRVDNPIDKSLVTSVRLVDGDGIINPRAFYNYLTAWVSNDALAYSASQASLRPEPRQWIHVPQDVELKIPKSQPLLYTQLPFYLNDMGSTRQITETVQAVRTICQKFEEKGLSNFPTGIPFVYWEQYIGLRYYLVLALACILTTVFLIVSMTLLNPWAAILMVVILTMTVLELFGLMGIFGIRLSAVPAVILIMTVGIGVEFTAHIIVGFLTSVGNRDRRMVMTLEHMFAPVVHGAMSTLLGIIMLAFSEFDFIIRYFFYVLSTLVIVGMVNGLLLLPILLSLVGPPGEIIPTNNPNRIDTPSPEVPKRQPSRAHHRRIYPRVNSEISLSTITEEPPSYQSSHEFVVHPEVVVETTTVTNTTANAGGSVATTCTTDHATAKEEYGRSASSSSENQSNSTSRENISGGNSDGCASSSTNISRGFLPGTTQMAVTTKVTTTAKVKVELHAPLPGYVERENNYKHKRWRENGSPDLQEDQEDRVSQSSVGGGDSATDNVR